MMNLAKTAKAGTVATIAGLGVAALGVVLSGGFGPCGPQHPGPFLVAILGVLATVAGMLCLCACFLVLASRKLKDLARPYHS